MTASWTGVDAHHDILMDVLEQHKHGQSGILSSEWGPRLRRGNVQIQVLPLFVEDKYLPGQGLREILRMIEAAYADIEHDDSGMELTTNATSIRQIIDAGKVAGVLALEGCDGLQEDPAMLRLLYRLGVRMVGLTWERRNAFADGTGVPNPGGLTKIGQVAVREMAAHNVLLDVSHLAEPGFWDALELAHGPIVASHSNARAVLDHPRNLTDDQIRAIAETGGVIGMNFFGFFIDGEHPTRDRMADHVAHIADLVGVQHIGIGADFLEGRLREMAKQAIDGTHIDPALLDFWIEDCQQADELPLFAETLRQRGFSDDEVAGVMGGNFMRVFEQVWR